MNHRIPTQPRWTRRAILASLVAPLSYVGYRIAAHNQWVIVTRNGREFAPGTEPERVDSTDQLSLLVVGDTGKSTPERASVVAAMRRHAGWSRPTAGLLLGDNFYERGVDSVDDPRFDGDFESLFDRQSFDMPFYVCLGNHDVSGDANAQVQYTDRSQRWKMFDRYYRVRQTAGRTTVDLFVLDTNLLLEDSPAAHEQLAWLHAELPASDAHHKIVIGHHPAITGGQHGTAGRIAMVLPPLFERYGVDLYLSGHDHDLQLLDSGHRWRQVVSGAGSKLRSTAWIDQTEFAQATPGFCWLLVSEDEIAISFYSTTERLCTRRVRKAGVAERAASRRNFITN